MTAMAMENPLVGKGLSSDFIDGLLSTTRTKNQYGPYLVKFYESDEPAIDVREVWPQEFGKKKISALYQGFRNAAEAADITIGVDGDILILSRNDTVFLLHNERVKLATTPKDVEVEDDTDDES